MAFGCAAVYNARAVYAFSAGIQCRHFNTSLCKACLSEEFFLMDLLAYIYTHVARNGVKSLGIIHHFYSRLF